MHHSALHLARQQRKFEDQPEHTKRSEVEQGESNHLPATELYTQKSVPDGVPAFQKVLTTGCLVMSNASVPRNMYAPIQTFCCATDVNSVVSTVMSCWLVTCAKAMPLALQMLCAVP